jgi:hypothetical protein
MTRAQPKSSPTDRFARQIARAISKGQPPPIGAELDEYCDNSPGEVFAAFTGIARNLPPTGKDEALAVGYLFLLQRLLEHLRYHTDRGYPEASALIADFQADVVAQVEAGEVDARILAFVGGALHQSKIPASPELVAASAKHRPEQDDDAPLPSDVRESFRGIVEACGDDPFTIVGSLSETSHALPAGARNGLAEAMALAGVPAARTAAVLLLLDTDRAVRHTVAVALDRAASSLTPTDVRRLIAMRNWRPEAERAEIDSLVRKARAAGIDCAQWDAGSSEAVFATPIDGAMAQAFVIVSPAGSKKRISSVLMKSGIADAWSAEPESRRKVEKSLAGVDVSMLAVSRPYLDRTVAHHLALSIEKGEAPPVGLLQVAEIIGGAAWQPARIVFSEALAGLIAEIPKAMCESAALAATLRKSDKLIDVKLIAQSWFEDDIAAAEVVKRARGGSRAKLADYLLQSLIAQRRDRWAGIVLHTALWMREAPPETGMCWRELALVAKALADGREIGEIGLMRDIALRTIAVLGRA